MAQVGSENTTAMSAVSTRRSFLSTAAGVAAGGTALVLATTAVAAPAIAPDPIFTAIEAHKAAYAEVSTVVGVHSELEEELPSDKRRSHVDRWEERIFETDDPRWIESERAVTRLWGAVADADFALIDIHPTTMAGLMALLNYVISADSDGEMWHVDLEADDGRTRSWHYFLIENVTAVLTDLARARGSV
jgi:hypothetical protein